MFRLTLASLLEMGYQVRFGILEVGAYGVSQSVKRAFIWAASPEEILPEWPEPMHVFAAPELKVTLSHNLQYAAVRSTANRAPFREITFEWGQPLVVDIDTTPTITPKLQQISRREEAVKEKRLHELVQSLQQQLLQCKGNNKTTNSTVSHLTEHVIELERQQILED
ncbi:hypothetical protein REPUB_Repub05bG0142900 [Reevesia pubescens]